MGTDTRGQVPAVPGAPECLSPARPLFITASTHGHPNHSAALLRAPSPAHTQLDTCAELHTHCHPPIPLTWAHPPSHRRHRGHHGHVHPTSPSFTPPAFRGNKSTI